MIEAKQAHDAQDDPIATFEPGSTERASPSVRTAGVDEAPPSESERRYVELEKLKEELVQLQRARRFGLVKTGAVALLTSLLSGIGGYVFGDSLEERTQAEMRTAAMQQYFAVENSVPGKRKQILDYIGAYLAKNDPELRHWVDSQKTKVAQQLDDVRAKIARLGAERDVVVARQSQSESELRKLENEMAQLKAERDTLRAERVALTVDAKSAHKKSVAESERAQRIQADLERAREEKADALDELSRQRSRIDALESKLRDEEDRAEPAPP